MRKVPEKEREQIVTDIATEFRCLGGGREPDPSNPLTHWTQDEPVQFALGVDVRKVVDYVISRL